MLDLEVGLPLDREDRRRGCEREVLTELRLVHDAAHRHPGDVVGICHCCDHSTRDQPEIDDGHGVDTVITDHGHLLDTGMPEQQDAVDRREPRAEHHERFIRGERHGRSILVARRAVRVPETHLDTAGPVLGPRGHPEPDIVAIALEQHRHALVDPDRRRGRAGRVGSIARFVDLRHLDRHARGGRRFFALGSTTHASGERWCRQSQGHTVHASSMVGARLHTSAMTPSDQSFSDVVAQRDATHLTRPRPAARVEPRRSVDAFDHHCYDQQFHSHAYLPAGYDHYRTVQCGDVVNGHY